MRVDFPHEGPDDLFDQWIGSSTKHIHAAYKATEHHYQEIKGKEEQKQQR